MMSFVGVKQVEPLNRGFLYIDSEKNSQDIAALMKLDSEPEVQGILSRIVQLVDSVPNLSFCVDQEQKRLSPAETSWGAQDNFSEVNLRLKSGETLDRYLGEICSGMLSAEKPAWSITLIRAQEGDPVSKVEFALLLRSHHVIADGLSLIEMARFLGGSSREKSLEKQYHALPKFKNSQQSLTTDKEYQTEKGLLAILRQLFRDVIRKRGYGPFNGENSGSRRLVMFDLPISILRKVKADEGCSLNDLVLGIVSGALERYQNKKSLKAKKTFVLVPVDLRRYSERLRIGNAISFFRFQLPIGTDSKARSDWERVREISRITKSSDAEHSKKTYKIAGRVLSWLPAPLAGWLAKRTMSQNGFICTNVPHFRGEIYVAGAKVTGIYGVTALLPSNGLGFSFVGYKDHYNVSIITDPGVVSDPELLQQSCLETFETIVVNQ